VCSVAESVHGIVLGTCGAVELKAWVIDVFRENRTAPGF